MVIERSKMTERWAAAGIEACNSGSNVLRVSTVSMMLAPDCLLTIKITEGLPSLRPEERKSSTESMT